MNGERPNEDIENIGLIGFWRRTRHPDKFLGWLMAEKSETGLSVIEEMRVKRKRPEISQTQLLEKLTRLSIPRFVGMLRNAGYGSQ